jgi:hypothetical protein
LGSAPIPEFKAVLVARRKAAKSYGLAVALAAEARGRWNADAASVAAAAAAADDAKIREAEELLADESVPAEEKPALRRYLAGLRSTRSETKKGKTA